jgi:hypothetical protein
MARIKTYENDTNVVSADKWIGSDSQQNYRTKNFTAGDVANFINQKATESQLLRYKYINEDDRLSGSISFNPYGADNVLFSTINGFMLSKYDLYSFNRTVPVDISSFYTNPLIGSDILITQADDVNNWAIYRWVNSTQDLVEEDFYNITVSYISGNGGLDKDEDYFISLLQYDAANASGDKNFVFTQNVASSTWVITHNLGKYPSVSIVDSADTKVNGDIQYDSINQVTVSFRSAFAGKAFLN